jgi:hypothetical protein
MMPVSPDIRLAWEISASRPQPAFFGAHIAPGMDVEELMQPALVSSIEPSEVSFLDPNTSAEFLDAIFADRKPPADTSIVFLEDALSGSSSGLRERLNRGRELLRRQRRTFVFAESRAGSPELFDDLRDFLAIFRDIVDLRPAASEDDHLWDTTGAFGRDRIAANLPAVITCGSILVKNGIVHRKAPRRYRCPTCGGDLTRTETVLHFVHAPAETASQTVRGYLCPCGETWPDPEVVRAAYNAAFHGRHRS